MRVRCSFADCVLGVAVCSLFVCCLRVAWLLFVCDVCVVLFVACLLRVRCLFVACL